MLAGGLSMDWRSLIAKLLEDQRFPLVLIVLGIAVSTVGALGSLPYLISTIDSWGRIGLGAIGLVILLLGIILFYSRTKQSKLPNPAKYQFKIMYPRSGSPPVTFNGFLDLSGTYGKEPPEGYTLAIIELIGANRFAFRRDVELGQNKTWLAKAVWAGTKRGQEKEFRVVLVGRSGKALWDYWEKVGAQHNWEIPPIDKGTDDILECARVRIVTGG
jgi:hypothetical protein